VKALWLLRHAHAPPGDPGSADHDRPLSGRGRNAAARIAARLAAESETPSLILCSSARRTLETLDPLVEALPGSPQVRTERDLYLASDEALLARLSRLAEGEPGVLVLAHNPGLHTLACTLAGGGEPSLLRRLERSFPSAACAAFRFDGAWRDLRPGTARLLAFSTPGGER
jgi:phosphohistidine phosphatase